ncbi:MAG: hypothetical protein GX538_06535 [Gammaproteobacteria bacterium]|nr:hypothetical protein [Gammaproteobacteria bacterium]
MKPGFLLAALLLAAPGLQAEPVTVYECTEPDGIITVRTGSPCPPGQPQRIRVVDPPPPLTLQPAHVQERRLAPQELPKLRAGTATAAGAEAAEPPPPEPPPPLFQCVRYDGHRYFHDDGQPEPHCRPLQTVGIGGVPGIGAGQACERVYDECEPVPPEALCQAWDTRVREAEFHWKFAGSSREARPLQARHEELAAILAGSTCAAPVAGPQPP